MSTVINFDSNDWNSIEETIKKLREVDQMQVGTTSEGEDILFSVGCDGEGGMIT